MTTVQQCCDKPGVLVVDDEPLVRSLVSLGLERVAFEVWTAANGREAIELYRQERSRIAVVVLDVRMPGLDGPATLDALREVNPDVVACFMSGDMGGYEPDELIGRGAACVIAKPFHLNELADIVRLLVHGVSAERPVSTL
jgi:CheY-like chemotaxis protein